MLSVCRGSHSCHTAIAQKTMGWQCASKAGSTRPRRLPSAIANVTSRSPPPTVRAVAAATALRCCNRSLLDTPVTACPNVRAAIPPVRIKRGTLTPALRRRWNRAFLARKLARRACATLIFLLLPAPRADPRDVTRCARRSLRPGTALTSSRSMRSDEAQQTHFESDSLMRRRIMTETRYRKTALMSPTTSRSRAVDSTVMSSTYTVRMVCRLILLA